MGAPCSRATADPEAGCKTRADASFVGDTEFVLIPVWSGETSGALMLRPPLARVLFTGTR
jgi:hypothetical protein